MDPFQKKNNCSALEEDDKLKIVNTQFNFLDVIANQETIIALIGFVRRVFPAGQTALQPQYSLLNEESARLSLLYYGYSGIA